LASRATVIADADRRIFSLSRGVASDTVVLDRHGPAGSGRPARLRILRDGGDQMRLSVAASGQGYLVVADAIQHGWKASLDGRPVPIRQADHAGVAVLVPSGLHQVTLRYDPSGWKPGLVASGISVLLLLAFAVWLPRRPMSAGAWW
jgi:hypothetical protein